MNRIFAAMLAISMLLLTSLSALADDAGKLGVKIKQTTSGKDMPGLLIQPQADVVSVTVKLKRSDGKTTQVGARNVRAGSSKTLAVPQGPGTFEYTGKFKVKWGSGESSKFTMKFKLTRAQKLALTIKPQDVDLDARKMSFSINNRASKATLEIYGQNRKLMKKVTRTYNGASGGSALKIDWPKQKGDILYMDLKVYDMTGFWKGVRLTPFSISIPHDDVEFESGKWNIRRSEEPKLKDTMGHIKANLEKHGTLLTLKLFIAGYTDTVGTTASNETLSRNRARSIARWFRRNGLKIPVYYQGFGERVLAVQTPDNTDEARNRRAVYILSSQIPGKSKTIPDANWKKL